MKYSKLSAAVVAALLIGSPSFVPVSGANSDDAKFGTTGSVPYVSGGVGTDSSDKLSSLAGDFNVKFLFALKNGDYVTGVKVAIANAAGKSILDATSDGPMFLTKLPAGNYQVAATLSGNTVKRQIAVGGGKLQTVDFRWASE